MDKAALDLIDKFFMSFLVAKFLLNTGRLLIAIQLCKECLIILCKKALERQLQFVNFGCIAIYNTMLQGYRLNNDYASATECCRNLLTIARRSGERECEGRVVFELASLNDEQSNYKRAKDLFQEALCIMRETGQRKGEGACYENLGTVLQHLGEYGEAKEYLQKAIMIRKELGDKKKEASCYGHLANVFQCLSEYDKAGEYLQEALTISRQLGDRRGEAWCYGNLGTLYQYLSEYNKAEEFLLKAIVIRKELGDRKGEAANYGNLATVFHCRGQHTKAKEYIERGLAIKKEVGDRYGEATDYGNLGTVCQSLGEHSKAVEYLQKGLAVSKEIGNREGEAANYGNLATVFQSLGQYAIAEEYIQKSLPIRKEIGDRYGEAADYGSLGTLFCFRGEHDKAEKYLHKSLLIRGEIGDRHGEGACHGNLGAVFISLGEYVKAEEHLQKALMIRKEIGDRQGEADDYANLHALLDCVGEHAKAETYLQKSLVIFEEIGDLKGEAMCYQKTAKKLVCHGEYAKAEKCLQKSLDIRQKLGDRRGEAACYGRLGDVSQYLDEHDKAQEYLQKAITIAKEIGDRESESLGYRNLGTLYQLLGEYKKARAHHKKALEMSIETEDIDAEFHCYLQLTLDALLEQDMDRAFINLFASIQTNETMRHFLRNNDQFKVSLLDAGHDIPYRTLSELLCFTGYPVAAIFMSELARARALAELMFAQYSFDDKTVDPCSWSVVFENISQTIVCSCADYTFLYISYVGHSIFLWIINAGNEILFREIDPNNCFNDTGSTVRRRVDEIFDNETCRWFQDSVPQDGCEDRSLFHVACESSLIEGLTGARLIEQEDGNEQPDPTLAQCYKMLIEPVVDILDKTTEIVIVPDRVLWKVPFSALPASNGNDQKKYLSETFRIRIIPSLMTLHLILDSPADYHSQTGALIVGEPRVNEVYYKGRIEKLCPLPCARKEAEMIGRLLGAQPLLGQQATKRAVLRMIHSVALIHFAAHGNAERGEIALAPEHANNGIPHEDEYLLTMADISRVRLRARLVVISCCHSARGHISSDGVVGIARAFLGSGARSVLVALWALEDKATEQFMSRFYEHLVRGESASEALFQAMKWMRDNGFANVEQWAPFMLIGDNVKFNFENE